MCSIHVTITINILLCTLAVLWGLRYKDTYLPELAVRINNTFASPCGTSDQLFRDIYVYFEELDGIRKELKEGLLNGLDLEKDLPQQFKKYIEVKEMGGPIHLQAVVDIKLLTTFYKWNTEHISEFYELLQFTNEAWEKIQTYLQSENDRPPLTFMDKVKLNINKEKG